MLLLKLPRKQNGRLVECITLLTHNSAKMWTPALTCMKAYLWSTNNGNARWTINGHQGHRQGTNETGECQNR